MRYDSDSVRRATLLASSVAILAPMQAWAQQTGRTYGHMWDGGWHGWFFGPFMMILLVVLVVLGVLIAVRWSGGDTGRRDSSGGTQERTPLDILKERFARGEIDKAEFEERRRALED